MSTTHVGSQGLTVRLPAVVDPRGPLELEVADAPAPEPPHSRSPHSRPERRRRVRADLLLYALFVACALVLTRGYWLGNQVSRVDISDQAFFEYMLSHGAYVVTHLANPFYTTQLNAPVGVNLMSNTSILALTIPLAPVTLLFGPTVSFALLMTLSLAGTAAAWHFVLSRHVVESRSAAIIGAFIAGFGPGMVSHATGHPNIVAQFLLPFIALRTVKLIEPGRTTRNGILLGLLITAQVFINEEILFIAAIAMVAFVIAYAVLRWPDAKADLRPFATGLGVAAGVAFVLLAYPLWWQFFGPNTYHGLDPGVRGFSTDVAAFPALATQTVFGGLNDDARLSQSLAEQNTFLGWPLVIAAAISVYWLRHRVLARALAISALVLGVLSLGPVIKIDGHVTGIPGPWRLVADVPVFDSAVPTRFSLLILPIVAVLVAMAHDRLMDRAPVTGAGFQRQRLVWCLLLIMAAVTVLPTPIPTQTLPPTPAFISSGLWRQYVPAGDTVLPVPVPGPGVVDSMFWAARTNLGFEMPRGYFLGPDPTHGNVAFFGAPARPTATLLSEVYGSQVQAVVHPGNRADAVVDLRYWHTAVILLPPGTRGEEALHATISDLVGSKPKFIGGMWVWDVRGLLSGQSDADLE
jgi:hypothetical protein